MKNLNKIWWYWQGEGSPESYFSPELRAFNLYTDCTFDSVISNDNTKKHWRMYPSKNAMFANHIALFAIRNQTTYGDVFVKDISI